ncbi:5-carboxymethyl-2-hydroxymuconate isomerase [Thiothrix eikelboomii]|uniref:5-carboxymethyl-2-hydroxymuconate isomerase n=1 Tax=Thiothrix eikelboomii TaxID=92487 RepID=A0A1T4Y2D6_9GAMM|nr:fumarylacetoacetate hydrolase family protein [Thiothrix eikelboomii]SKA95783.1 5-carboxymethyl-2-hydroxymuconate isomerase [Thiothrix eikelboomii]
MRLASYRHGQREAWGIITEDEKVLDCSAVAPTLKAAIEQNQLSNLTPSSTELALSEVTLLPPILHPEKIICIGVNYANRNAEYRDNSNEAAYPSVFMRTPDSLTGHNNPLIRPPESQQLDYEGEIVLVIGQGGRRIRQADAYQHIAGLTIMNEGTLRDWVRHAKFNVTQGKNFVHSGSLGPWMVTADQFNPQVYENMTVTTRVNGEVRQHDTTANIIFPFAYIIHYLSTFYLLKPGDIIATGTPNGAGARFDPPRYLIPGDIVEVEVAGVGTLRNGIADESI